MVDVGEMGANLMGAPGFGLHLKQGARGKGFQYRAGSDGGFALLEVNHGAVMAVAIDAQGEFEDDFLPVGRVQDESVVGLFNLTVVELQVDGAVSLGRAGKQ